MGKHDIHIETKEIAGTREITVDRFVTRQDKGKVIKFHNDLEKTTGDPEDGVNVELTFYEIVDGVVSSTPVQGFCGGNETVLLVKANKHKNCTLADNGYFKFDAVATGYDPYDPIIIVDVPPAFYSTFVFSAVFAVAAAAVGFYAGFRTASKKTG